MFNVTHRIICAIEGADEATQERDDCKGDGRMTEQLNEETLKDCTKKKKGHSVILPRPLVSHILLCVIEARNMD